MTSVKPGDFEKGEYKWYDLRGKHIVVTYEHASTWEGTPPTSHADMFPHTVAKLRDRLPLTIVAYGDSITLGIGTSAFSQIPPYMPTWPEIAVRGLEKAYRGSRISLINTALGGMTSQWAVDNATSAVADLNPDLVLIAFGMNDFWGISTEDFKHNVLATMHRISEKNPNAEFLLIAPMKFDPVYATEAQYPERLASYAPALKSLEGSGVQVLDMTAITSRLYEQKKPKDFISDPLHPNDFLARWYAQGVVATLSPQGG
jgi:lysophospholipase L1-like esterase